MGFNDYPRTPQQQPSGWRSAALTSRQIDEIVAAYAAALEMEPGLSKSEFARRTAPQYGVSGATIRKKLNH
mgnify:CR=1 FL=1